MSQPTTVSSSEPTRRLPCRGCLPDCANYATCDGKPWRADKAPDRPHVQRADA